MAKKLTKDGRALTSAINGRKGGKPVSDATIKAQLARQYIAEQVHNSLSQIVAKAIEQAVQGDFKAREWLSSYAWGKPAINLGVDETGQPLKIVFDPAFNEEVCE